MIGVYLSVIESASMKEKFEFLYRTYRLKAYNIAYSYLHDPHLAEDAVMESFLALAKDMGRLSDKTPDQSRNYLFMIVRNRAIELFNETKGIDYLEETDAEISDESDIELEIENKELQKRIFELIKTLGFKYSDVLIMKYFYGMKNYEIARALGVNVNNINKRMARAKDKLKKLIAEEELYEKGSF